MELSREQISERIAQIPGDVAIYVVWPGVRVERMACSPGVLKLTGKAQNQNDDQEMDNILNKVSEYDRVFVRRQIELSLADNRDLDVTCQINYSDEESTTMRIQSRIIGTYKGNPLSLTLFTNTAQIMNVGQRALDQLMLQEEYECVGLIDVVMQRFTIISLKFGDINDLNKNGDSYDAGRERSAALFVAEEDKKHYMACTNLDTIVTNLMESDAYFFTIGGKDAEGRKRLRKFNYHFLGEDHCSILATIEDVTPMLHHDMLTGEYNRNGFIERSRQIMNSTGDSVEYAVLFFNIKGFKAINELFGLSGGDIVLRETAQLIKESALCPLVIGRIEADHFVALIERTNLDLKEITRICHRSYSRKDQHFKFYGRCGIYLVIDQSMPISGMCDRAKLAKDYIADDYVKPYSIFDHTMREAFVREKELTSELEHALEHNEFRVYYQPIYDTYTHRVVSAEALVRWIHPTQGVISPDMFVPVFEANGYISELDLFVAKSAYQFVADRVNLGQFAVPVAVNLSRMDFYDEGMMALLREELIKDSRSKNYARLEVTESAYTALGGQGISILSDLKALGITLLVDDFGSGYSSFSTIQNFDFDIIKLDMGFIQQIGKNVKSEWIIQCIIEMAHHIDVKLIAEGVETQAQLDFLAKLGCDYIQGYYFSTPLPEHEFAQLLDREQVYD